MLNGPANKSGSFAKRHADCTLAPKAGDGDFCRIESAASRVYLVRRNVAGLIPALLCC
ncbi:hypothetical protein KCP75_19265 [Salmonella enterica subsp. enterica]|nr:hypothetical protein KCP75_19265 [Salmonella enterica subsp. enterica]